MPYIVTSKQGIDINTTISRDLESASAVPKLGIPTRAVPKIQDNFDSSTRNDTFDLTKEEAKNLYKDSRVEFVQKVPSGGFPNDSHSLVDELDLPLYINQERFRNHFGPQINFGDTRIATDMTVVYNSSQWSNSLYKTNNSYKNTAHIYQTAFHPLPSGSLPSGSTSYLDMVIPDSWERSNLGNPFPTSGSFGRGLDGEGVDLIIIDGLTQFMIPEFLKDPLKPFITSSNHNSAFPDEFNRGRGVQYKWYEELGIDKTDPISHYRAIKDSEGNLGGSHGTACLSLAAGNVFGWAPKARLYKIDTIPSQTNPSIFKYPYNDVFPMIKRFHESKSIDPNTGYKRPTVVTTSISQGYNLFAAFNQEDDGLSHVNVMAHTGSIAPTTGNDIRPKLEYGFTQERGNGPQHAFWRPSIAADVDECAALGIIIVSSGGNRGNIQASKYETGSSLWREDYSGPYYDSYYTYDIDTSLYDAGEKIYYQRPSVPGGNGVVKVAEVNFQLGPVTSGTPFSERYKKLGFGLVGRSSRGPRMDATGLAGTFCANVTPWTPGMATHSAYIKYDEPGTPPAGYPQYFKPEGFVELYNRPWVSYSGGGTSMAAPQIAGMACLWKQLYPNGSVNEFKDFLNKNKILLGYKEPDAPEGQLLDPTTNLATNTGVNPQDTSSIYFNQNLLIRWPTGSNGSFDPDSAPNIWYPLLGTTQNRAADNQLGLNIWPYNAQYFNNFNFSVDFDFKI